LVPSRHLLSLGQSPFQHYWLLHRVSRNFGLLSLISAFCQTTDEAGGKDIYDAL
jgi:hypothetical protein